MKRPAKKMKVNKGLLGAVGAAVLGVAAGATAIFMSKKENREAVKRTVDKTVKRGKMEVAKVKKTLAKTKKKIVKK